MRGGRAAPRAVATARVTREPPVSGLPGPVARGIASPVTGARHAEPMEPATMMFQPPDVTGAIFVDGSGRRGRRLRRAVYALVAVLLVLLAAFWLLQGLDVFEFGT
ncbi:hypothetical protein GA0070603_3413 [Micromonospora chersina]|uniref:Uncharacterized protein n=2 Tax=Micromonospora chersina TaxID=47854 RepID=A0A1C6V823_9ACTN|nr:hypothetical protein GA0070603_3413 [Micromonospora chersina]